GRADTRMGHTVAAASVQFRDAARGVVARTAVVARGRRADPRARARRADARGPRDHRPRRDPRCALRLSKSLDLALRRGGCGRRLARLVDLLGERILLGHAGAGGRLHRLVLAAQEGERRAQGRGEEPMTLRRETTPGSVPAVRRGDALDVAELPSYGFGHRSLM